MGRWPSLDSAWNETDFELDDILLALSRTRPFAHLPLFTADIKPDFEDPSSYAIYVSGGWVGEGAGGGWRGVLLAVVMMVVVVMVLVVMAVVFGLLLLVLVMMLVMIAHAWLRRRGCRFCSL